MNASCFTVKVSLAHTDESCGPPWLYCKPVQRDYSTVLRGHHSKTIGPILERLRDREAERRRDARFACCAPAHVTMLHPGPAQSCAGTVLDVSKTGLRVRTSLRADKGCSMEIKMARVVAFGDVRYCLETADGQFDIGVLITDVLSCE